MCCAVVCCVLVWMDVFRSICACMYMVITHFHRLYVLKIHEPKYIELCFRRTLKDWAIINLHPCLVRKANLYLEYNCTASSWP